MPIRKRPVASIKVAAPVATYCVLPTPATDVLDAERLIEELQQALNAPSSSISADAVFEGLAAAAREVEDTLSATID
ncbi:uncharacterized protein Aud_002331 [Aspergillus udagawae]|uniref:Uncharacterized protein n=1 Tax=Aspergillus udagawae TaxID=91492 RepID=A0A8E0QL17_9EURO|nr:uncharacterized protein Aud_002331 [Aspergillus udagawae]GIC85972.1 hypothetical protein Aud_002331 [Aspergillus udagawae]